MDFYGNFYMSNTTDVELAAMDSEQSIAVEIKHDDKLSEAEGAFVQVAWQCMLLDFLFCLLNDCENISCDIDVVKNMDASTDTPSVPEIWSKKQQQQKNITTPAPEWELKCMQLRHKFW